MTNEEAMKLTAGLWEGLANSAAETAAGHIANGEPLKAIQYAMVAEACWWQSTGEADTYGLKDTMRWLGADEPQPAAQNG